MIRLASLIKTFGGAFLDQYRDSILPAQRNALAAMAQCRTVHSPRMQAHCTACDTELWVPHSCGHRSCPHCQHHESQQWLERQLHKQVPAEYFLLTFTLPAELRSLARQHPRALDSRLIQCSWETVKTFARNDRQLHGAAGAIAVLHTHSRRLDFHPHVHLVMPAAAIDEAHRLWRTKRPQRKSRGGYLFNHQALAKVFRAKMLEAMAQDGLALPARYPQRWVVDCKHVGRGEKALVYLGRYLYRGVIQEKDIVACENGQVTFRYRDAKSQQTRFRTVPGPQFLWLVLQHVLPKGLRRARTFGFLHPNSKRLIALLQVLVGFDPKRALARLKPRPALRCPCCGADMRIERTRIPPPRCPIPLPVPIRIAPAPAIV